MLGVDAVEARVKDGMLVLRRLDERALAEAEVLAGAYLKDADANVGSTRGALDEAWDAHDVGARSKLAAGLRKLADDACVWRDAPELDAVALRRDLFRRAASMRRSGTFDREAAVAATAAGLGLERERIETALFADRRSEHVLERAPRTSATALVDAYELGRVQAVLLRAVRVTCEIQSASPGVLRAFFAKLKFHRLLFAIERIDASRYRIVLDGPFSMFESVTRYGLALALVLPALRAIDAWKLEADVRWGKERTPAIFRASSTDARKASPPHEPEPPVVDEEVARVRERIEATPGFHAEIARDVLVHSGGVVVPDLVVTKDGSAPVYVELLGYWSRDAVWRRVEAAAGGLGANVVFCANARLRVSEEVLDEDAHAALYVYKNRIAVPALLDRIARLA